MAAASGTASPTASLNDHNPNQSGVKLLSRLSLFVQPLTLEEHPTAPSTRVVAVAFQGMPQPGALHLSQAGMGTGVDLDGNWRLASGEAPVPRCRASTPPQPWDWWEHNLEQLLAFLLYPRSDQRLAVASLVQCY